MTRLQICNRRLATVALVAAIPLWCGSGAHAQSGPEPLPEKRAFGEVRTGALSVIPRLHVLDVGIDTNPDNEGRRRDPDFTATVKPEITAWFTRPKLQMRASAETAFVYYRKHENGRSVNPVGRLSVQRWFSSSLSVEALGGVSWSKARVGLEIDARPRVLIRETALITRVDGRRLGFSIAGGYRQTTYENEARYVGISLPTELNRISRSLRAAVDYRLTPFTTVALGAEIATDRFGQARRRDLDSGRFFAAVSLKPRSLLSGGAEIGYRVGRTLDVHSPDYSGPVARGGITYSLNDRLLISAGGERNLEFSFQPNWPYYVYDLYEAAVRKTLGDTFDVGLGGTRAVLWYRTFTDSAPPLPAGGFVDRVKGLTVSMGMRLPRRARLGYYVAVWRRPIGERAYREIRSGFQMTIGRGQANERGVFMNGPPR